MATALRWLSGELDDARAQLETMKAEEKRLHELAEDEAHLVRVRSAKSSVEAIAVLELAWNEPEHTITARDVVPEVFMGPLMGVLLDRSPGVLGHQHVFALVAASGAAGLVLTLAFRRITRRGPIRENTHDP